MFSSYQPSCMGTQKRRALDYLSEVIERLGGIQFMDAALYSSAHKRFKISYWKRSRRNLSAMKKVIARGNWFLKRCTMFWNLTDRRGRVNVSSGMAVYNPEEIFVRYREKQRSQGSKTVLLETRSSNEIVQCLTLSVKWPKVFSIKRDVTKATCSWDWPEKVSSPSLDFGKPKNKKYR